MKSIYYYDKHADEYFDKTLNLDMSKLYQAFQSYLSDGASILDLGCGSGRDSQYFNGCGYKTTSMDGSIEMVRLCKTFLKSPVIHSTFKEFKTTESFDGIWASASLLHVDRRALAGIIEKYISYLKINGVFFMSFKIYKEDFEYDGRYFTCFTNESLEAYLSGFENVEIVSVKESQSVQKSDVMWVSAILRKKA